MDQIRVQQPNDVKLVLVLANIEKFVPMGYSQRGDGLLFQGRSCVPDNEGIRQEILFKAHKPHYIRQGMTKMY